MEGVRRKVVLMRWVKCLNGIYKYVGLKLHVVQ